MAAAAGIPFSPRRCCRRFGARQVNGTIASKTALQLISLVWLPSCWREIRQILEFTAPPMWPPNLPALNPVDYGI